MGCDEIREILPSYAAGEAGDSERIAAESHVPLCAECRGEFEKYREVRGVLGVLREGEAPAGTFEAVWRGVRAEIAPRRAVSRLFDWMLRAAALLVIGLSAGYVVSIALPDRPAAGVASEDAYVPGGGVPAHVVRGGDRAPSLKDRMHPEAVRLGNHYLPHVQAVVSPSEVDW